MSNTPDRQAVSRRAYELFVSRGGEHGHDKEDWYRAEQELASTASPANTERGVANPGDREKTRETPRETPREAPREATREPAREAVSAAKRPPARTSRPKAAAKK